MDLYKVLLDHAAETGMEKRSAEHFYDYLRSLPDRLDEDEKFGEVIEIFSLVDKERFSLVPWKITYEAPFEDGEGFTAYWLDMIYAGTRIGSFSTLFDKTGEVYDESLQLEDFRLIKKFCKSVKK